MFGAALCTYPGWISMGIQDAVDPLCEGCRGVVVGAGDRRAHVEGKMYHQCIEVGPYLLYPSAQENLGGWSPILSITRPINREAPISLGLPVPLGDRPYRTETEAVNAARERGMIYIKSGKCLF